VQPIGSESGILGAYDVFPRLLVTAALFQFVTYACYYDLTPLYPEISRDLGVDAGTLGSIVGAGGIVSVLMQVPAGSGGDRWGRRPFFATAMVLLVVSQVARWLADAPLTLLAAQVLAGAAQGIATVNAWALVADAAESRGRHGQAFGILNASLALALVAGYLLGGGIGDLIGWRLMSLALASMPLVALPGLAWVPGHKPHAAAARVGLVAVLGAVLHPQRLAFTAIAALTLGAGQGAIYLLPFGIEHRDPGSLTAALLLVPYVFGSVLAGPLAGRLSDQLGTPRVLVALLAVGALSAVALVWGTGTTLLLVACFILIGASVNGVLPLLAARVLSLGDPAGVGAGSIMAGLRIGQSSGSFIGPAMAGLVFARAGLSAGWLTQAAGLIASLVIWTLLRATSIGADQDTTSGAQS
jgi:predicted MFS family arabinose efflux permease